MAPAPGQGFPDTRIFLFTGFFWTVPLAITEPFKSLYLNRHGLDNQALGGVSGLDMGMRTLGVIAGGWFGTRLGHKRVLIGGDVVSWVLSTLVLALARELWHLYVWAGLMSANSVVSASVQHLLVKAVQALSMVTGIYWRWKGLGDARENPGPGEKDLGLVQRLADIALEITATPGSWAVLAVWVLANQGGNVWRVYLSVFAVERCGQTAAMLGWMTQAGALAFVIVSLWLLPRLDARKQPRAFLIANLASVAPALVLVFQPGWSCSF